LSFLIIEGIPIAFFEMLRKSIIENNGRDFEAMGNRIGNDLIFSELFFKFFLNGLELEKNFSPPPVTAYRYYIM
jgi:hypothetical protein